MLLYHGSSETVEFPEIRKARFNKDFYFGFYCTQYREQAVRSVSYTHLVLQNWKMIEYRALSIPNRKRCV